MSINQSLSVICFSSNEQNSKDLCEKFTNQKSEINNLYTNTINNIHLTAYPRWPNCSKYLQSTAISDGLLITVESLEEYYLLENYLKSKERLSCLVFLTSSDKIKAKASEFKNGKFFDKSTPMEAIREHILIESIQLSKTIRKIFDTLDTNKSGFLEKKEILNYARDNGENVSSTEFVDTLNLVDRHGLGKICFEDFEKWWKLGGHTNNLFSRLVRLSDFSKGVLNDEKFELLKAEMKEEMNFSQDRSSTLLKFHSGDDLSSPGFQFYLNVVVGCQEKDNAKNTYLDRHPDTNNLKNSNWLQIVLKSDEQDVKKVANSVRFLKTSFFELLERTNRHTVSFIRSFFEIEEHVLGNNVYLTFKLKRDIQDFFENAVLPLLQFFDLFATVDASTQLLVDFQTECSLKEIFSQNFSVKEALESFILEIKANTCRSHIRKISKIYKFDNELDSLLWYITSAENSDFNCKISAENVFSTEKSEFKLGFIGELIDFYMNQYGFDLPSFPLIENIELALNFNKLFINSRLKIK